MPDQDHGKPTAVGCDLGELEAVQATRMPMPITDAQEPGSPVLCANGAAIVGEHAGPEVRARIEAALASRAPAPATSGVR